jgi:hypothetical protein
MATDDEDSAPKKVPRRPTAPDNALLFEHELERLRALLQIRDAEVNRLKSDLSTARADAARLEMANKRLRDAAKEKK